MKHTASNIALAMLLSFSVGAAFAHGCPREMKAIDAALPNAKISAAQMDEVKKLRADGEVQHKAGKHDESMASLGKAKTILGIK
jgi:hypothetical protein